MLTVCSLSLGRGGLQCGDCLFSSLGSGGLQCGDCLFSFFGEGRSAVWRLFIVFLWGGEVCSVVTVCSLSLGRGGLQCGDCLFSFFGEGRSSVW